MKKLFTLLFASSFCSITLAQHAKISPSANIKPLENIRFTKSQPKSEPCLGLRKYQDIEERWLRTVSSRAISHGAPNKSRLEQIKEEKTRLKFENISRDQNPEEIANPLAVTPTVGTNFLGNELFGGTPVDNSMGISNGGIIVSADNATMEVYDGDAQDP